MKIEEYQTEVAAWSLHNFGDTTECAVELAALGLAEEAGEVNRALLKRMQGIRGTREEWTTELRNEIGDVFIKLCDLAEREGVSLADCIAARWAAVSQRNWRKDTVGHGIPAEPAPSTEAGA